MWRRPQRLQQGSLLTLAQPAPQLTSPTRRMSAAWAGIVSFGRSMTGPPLSPAFSTDGSWHPQLTQLAVLGPAFALYSSLPCC